jgi:hypothetical protein
MSITSLKKNKAAKPIATHGERPFTSPIASAVVTVIAVLGRSQLLVWL